MRPRIAIVGHVVRSPNSIDVPESGHAFRSMLKLYNYTRVRTKDNRLVDHIA
jgi:hypothetical protein